MLSFAVTSVAPLRLNMTTFAEEEKPPKTQEKKL